MTGAPWLLVVLVALAVWCLWRLTVAVERVAHEVRHASDTHARVTTEQTARLIEGIDHSMRGALGLLFARFELRRRLDEP